jgi:hypothetical protein
VRKGCRIAQDLLDPRRVAMEAVDDADDVVGPR